MTTMTQTTAPTTTEIVLAKPAGDGYTCYDVFGNVVACGEHGTKLLARTLISLWRERKKKGGEKPPMNTIQRSDHKSGVKGVTWNGTVQRWRVLVRRGKGYEILGSFAEEELDKAIAMKQEADALHPAEYQALKAKYGVGKKRKRHPWGYPAAESAAPAQSKEIVVAPATTSAPILSNDPATLLEAAEAADADALMAQQAAERANQTAIEAMERASTLWARLAAVLRVRHKDSAAFRRSPLGEPNGQSEPKE